MKIISFLGFNNYTETTYIHPSDDSKQSKTSFFQEALVEFYQPETLYVLLTETVETKIPKGATESNWIALQKRLVGKVNLEPVFNRPVRNIISSLKCLHHKQPKEYNSFLMSHSFSSELN